MPWQRIINASSTISPRGDGGAAARRQAERLREEGVAVTQVRTKGRGLFNHLRMVSFNCHLARSTD